MAGRSFTASKTLCFCWRNILSWLHCGTTYAFMWLNSGRLPCLTEGRSLGHDWLLGRQPVRPKFVMYPLLGAGTFWKLGKGTQKAWNPWSSLVDSNLRRKLAAENPVMCPFFTAGALTFTRSSWLTGQQSVTPDSTYHVPIYHLPKKLASHVWCSWSNAPKFTST